MHGDRIQHPKGYLELQGNEGLEILDAYYTLVVNRRSSNSKPDEMLEQVNPGSVQLGVAVFNWGNLYRERRSQKKSRKAILSKKYYPLVEVCFNRFKPHWKPTDSTPSMPRRCKRKTASGEYSSKRGPRKPRLLHFMSELEATKPPTLYWYTTTKEPPPANATAR